MTNLLDIRKEAELRVRLTECFRSVGAREVLPAEVLQRRLLLCLYGLGTNAGLKLMCSGGGEDSYSDLQYVRRRYITKEQLRAAIRLTAVDRRALSPLKWQHVNPYGTFTLNMQERMPLEKAAAATLPEFGLSPG